MTLTDNQQSVSIRDQYKKLGYCHSEPLFQTEELLEVNKAVDDILNGKYETDTPPFHTHKKEHLTQSLVKIDNAQRANRTVLSFLSSPKMGKWIAEATGADKIQIWSTQLLIKRPDSVDNTGGVGWHRDENYWKYWTDDSELFTAWVALSDVREESGPVCMIPGSHRWPDSGGGNFFDNELDSTKKHFSQPEDATWDEVPMILKPGAVSLHDKRTIHGSYNNRSNEERRSFAIHLCSGNARVKEGKEDELYVRYLNDKNHAPLLYGI